MHETLSALETVHANIPSPKQLEKFEKLAEEFWKKRCSPFNGFIAALDGIAIQIRGDFYEVDDPKNYFDRKGWPAVAFLAAVNANYRFIYFSARRSGSTHYSTSFMSTANYNHMISNNMPKWAVIVCDPTCANEGSFMTS